jgi:hypothetical protein
VRLSEYIAKHAEAWVEPTIDPKGFDELEISTPITPAEYLEFAEKDLRRGGPRGLVNALSNSKRAIDCQIANLLMSVGLGATGNFPSRVEKLQSLGLVAPRILRKIVQLRNALEHDYHKPTIAQVEDAVDIATLFLESMKPFVSGGAYMSSCWLADHTSENPWPFVKKDGITTWDEKNNPKYTFSRGIYVDSDLKSHAVSLAMIHDNRELGEVEIKSRDAIYVPLQAFLIKCRPEAKIAYTKRGARDFLALLKRHD